MKENKSIRNSVVIRTEFYFKGKYFTPSVHFDLDRFFQAKQHVDSCYIALAKANNIGLHSHELDVMMCEELLFSEPTGWAEGLVENGQLDWQQLEKVWQQQSGINLISEIANKYFNVENIDDHPRLAAALLDAYQAGSESASEKDTINKGLNEGFYG